MTYKKDEIRDILTEIDKLRKENESLREKMTEAMRECRKLEFIAEREKKRADEAEAKLKEAANGQ